MTMRQVINLTKMRGAGSLAHEWWHGLEIYGPKLAAKGLLSENPASFRFQKLIDTINTTGNLGTGSQAHRGQDTRYDQMPRDGYSFHFVFP
jgi:hypothetical protein